MPAVDIYPRCGQDAKSFRIVEVAADQFWERRVLQLFIETIQVQFQRFGDLDYLCVIQGVLVFKQLVVEFPEFALIVRRHGRGRRFPRKIVSRYEFVNQFYLFGILLQHLPE